MKSLPDKSFDAIITDPPWLVTKLSFDKTPLNFATLFKEFNRLLKDNGWFFLFGTVEMAAIALKVGWRRKFEYIWVKPGPVVAHPRVVRPLLRHEIVYSFIKTKTKPGSLYYDRKAISTVGKPYKKTMSRQKNISEYQRSQNVGDAAKYARVGKDGNTRTRCPSTVLDFPNKPRMDKRERTKHPTQKPIALMETLVKGYCPEDGLVLDPFGGSGSTLIACEKNNRKCITVEKDERYVDIIYEQIDKLNANAI